MEKQNYELPALVMEDYVPFPETEMRIDFKNNDALKSLKVAEQYNNEIVCIFPKGDANNYEFEEHGIAGKIILNMAMPGNSRRVKIQFNERIKITQVVTTSPSVIVQIEKVADVLEEEKAKQMMELVVSKLYESLSAINVPNFDALNKILVDKNKKPERFSDQLVNLLPIKLERKYAYLAELNVAKRFEMLIEDIALLKYYGEIDQKIEQDVKNNINQSQKEYYLREKIRAIQDELGDKVKKESDIEDLKQAIIDAKMPKNVEEIANKELQRYQTTNSASPESNIIRTYLDFIISLPWSIESTDTDDINKAKAQLDKDHYGLDKVKDRILEYLAVKILNKRNPQSILCLVGPPGVGKTSLARSVATALNKTFVKESLGGVRDEAEIRGHRRTYIGALPGRILQALARAKSKNPVFLLDEIDKLSSDYKGDPTSALLEVLDPEQNRYFSDHYVEVPFDLSQVFFICTANYIGNIPAPLRDRMEIVELSSYTEYEKFEIARRYLAPKQMELHGVTSERVEISDDAIRAIIQYYTRETGVRELERIIGSIIRKSIKKMLMENIDAVKVDKDNIEEYLGKQKFFNNVVDENDQVGVVTGLAYTQYGGDTLEVEVTYYKGSGKFVLTGQLGDVMKESAQAAMSYVKTNAEKLDIDAKVFEENDIHIHVPEGAIPKDGPSAGVTITTAIVSALSNKKVHHDLGMTGEITLRGRVLPIGGLREKSIAASRSGLHTILIPKDNVKDLDEVPESVKKSLTIIPVKTIDEVIKHAIISE